MTGFANSPTRTSDAAASSAFPTWSPASRYALAAAPFYDAFLAMILALIVAMVAALGLRGNIKAKQGTQIQEGEAE